MPRLYGVNNESAFNTALALTLDRYLLLRPFQEEVAMNHSLRSANVETHVRIVAIALAAGIVIVIGAFRAKLDAHNVINDAHASGGAIQAPRQTVHSRNERPVVR
jgi:hypothetical protein